MIYCYARVSTTGQNLDRQLEALEDFCGDEDNVLFTDKMSGKNFNRDGYFKMYKKLKKGDLVVVKSIDRLGRNYEMILDERRKITKIKECNIVILDMPLLDTREKNNNLTGRFISDLVLQILSYVAETERENIKKRQAEGIKIAKEKGVKFGRPKKHFITQEFINVYKKFKTNELNSITAPQELNISRASFFRLVNELETKYHLNER